jgi:septal ring-binding cell division protein DamX
VGLALSSGRDPDNDVDPEGAPAISSPAASMTSAPPEPTRVATASPAPTSATAIVSKAMFGKGFPVPSYMSRLAGRAGVATALMEWRA